MSNQNAPSDVRSFTLTVFFAFVVVFVFVMLMMLWHGNYKQMPDGTLNYGNQVGSPTDGNHD